MDLSTVDAFRVARTRDDLRLAPGETLLAGGTWLFSEPQHDVRGLVDLAALGWPPHERLADGTLRIAATCTIEELVTAPWGALGGLAREASDALLMSFKIQRVATVGGNVCLALPAGAMISLLAGLSADAVIWTPDGGERRELVATLVRGVRTTSLRPGEVLRAIDVPPRSLAAQAVLHRTSLAPLGRSAAVVVGVREVGADVQLTVTAATTRPVVVSDPAELADVDCWYDDPHGSPDWRAAVTATLARRIVAELAA